jgi:hypothetical protein
MEMTLLGVALLLTGGEAEGNQGEKREDAEEAIIRAVDEEQKLDHRDHDKEGADEAMRDATGHLERSNSIFVSVSKVGPHRRMRHLTSLGWEVAVERCDSSSYNSSGSKLKAKLEASDTQYIYRCKFKRAGECEHSHPCSCSRSHHMPPSELMMGMRWCRWRLDALPRASWWLCLGSSPQELDMLDTLAMVVAAAAAAAAAAACIAEAVVGAVSQAYASDSHHTRRHIFGTWLAAKVGVRYAGTNINVYGSKVTWGLVTHAAGNNGKDSAESTGDGHVEYKESVAAAADGREGREEDLAENDDVVADWCCSLCGVVYGDLLNGQQKIGTRGAAIAGASKAAYPRLRCTDCADFDACLSCFLVGQQQTHPDLRGGIHHHHCKGAWALFA